MRRTSLFSIGVAVVLLAGTATATTLWIGFDTSSPVQKYTSAGVFIANFGQGGATGTALDGAGHVWTVAPGANDSHIVEYDGAGNPLGTTDFTTGLGGGGDPSWIESIAYAGGNTLWLGAFNGFAYQINLAGTILKSVNTGHGFVGIATDGTFVYTSRGFDGGQIDKRDLNLNLISTINTSLTTIGGLAWDSSDSTFWAGGQGGLITHLSAAGATLGSFTTSTGVNFHDGLAAGEVNGGGAPTVPALTPAALAATAALLIMVGFYLMKRVRRQS